MRGESRYEAPPTSFPLRPRLGLACRLIRLRNVDSKDDLAYLLTKHLAPDKALSLWLGTTSCQAICRLLLPHAPHPSAQLA